MALALMVSRQGDKHLTGHPCNFMAPLAMPTINKTGPLCVTACGKPMAQIGDWDVPHLIPPPVIPPPCVTHAMPLAHGHLDLLVRGRAQSTVYSAIDAGYMIFGAFNVMKGSSNEAKPGTYAKAGGGGLSGTGAGSMADGGNTSMSAPMEF
jgi:hypothetical protein